MQSPIPFCVRLLVLLLVFATATNGFSQANQRTPLPLSDETIAVEVPEVIMAGTETEIAIKPAADAELWGERKVEVSINGAPQTVTLNNGIGTANHTFETTDEEVQIQLEGYHHKEAINPIPLWLSLVPPLLAILLALAFREVITSIGVGIFSGAAIIGFYNGGVTGIFSGFLAVVDTYVLNSLNDSGHLSIIIFSMLIGALVSVISKNGGMQGAVNRIARFATTPRSGQLATWVLGLSIFFDDYANTLVVGNTMRSVTDKLRISREKLSYLVDSTAAPVAAIAFVTTWIGAELGYIESGIEGIEALKDTGVYSIFINSLAYSFYPIFTLGFMLILIWKKRDFGPMFKAELRARTTGQVSATKSTQQTHSEELDEFAPADSITPRSYNALIPILVVIVGTMWGIWHTGFEALDPGVWSDSDLSFTRKLSQIVGGADSYYALLWSSAASLVVALLLTIGQRLLSLTDTVEAMMNGFKTMLPAIIILVLAWSLAGVTEHLHTADFLANSLSDKLSPYLVPAITFVLAALVAFSTGSSWGTMAILYPLLIPTTWEITEVAGWEAAASMPILYNVVASVLAGAVLGDHCSPISDTTILSSLASSCNHIDHVRTQLPYALTVGTVAILVGTIPAAFGLPSWMLFPLGFACLFGIVHFFGKEVPAQSDN